MKKALSTIGAILATIIVFATMLAPFVLLDGCSNKVVAVETVEAEVVELSITSGYSKTYGELLYHHVTIKGKGIAETLEVEPEVYVTLEEGQTIVVEVTTHNAGYKTYEIQGGI